MSYAVRIQESKEKVYSHAIATKILDLMDELRLYNNDLSKRRWIWELLQNAKDVSHPEKSVSIEINLIPEEDNITLDFSHDGLPFSIDNITFLIEQVSTKDRTRNEGEQPKTTGRFGTGFLSTHLLSEKVQVSGAIKEPDLPYRSFSLMLDRSGRGIEEIYQSVENSLSMLSDLDGDGMEVLENQITNFRYFLDLEGYSNARAGISDLHIAIPYTLAFNTKIQSVHVPHEGVLYEHGGIREISDEISIIRILKKTDNNIENIELAILSNGDVTIARQIREENGKIFVHSFNKELPRIFCDFPLIGTEDFRLPIVIQSSLFNPTVPRDGIFLSDLSDGKITENKNLILKGLELYWVLLDYARQDSWQDLYHLTEIKVPSGDKDWLSKTWFKTDIQKPVTEKLLKHPIVDTASGQRLSIISEDDKIQIRFPAASRKEVREKIWKLVSGWMPNQVPREDDIHDWYEVIWSGCPQLTLEELTKDIANMKSLDGVMASTGLGSHEEATNWLNEYYDLLNFEGEFIGAIIQNRFAVTPNQLGNFKFNKELLIDQGIEEELKNVLKTLGNDPRISLLPKGVKTASRYKEDLNGQMVYFPKSQESIIEEINNALKKSHEKRSEAIGILISLFAEDPTFSPVRDLFYQFNKAILKEEIPERKTIAKWSPEIWEVCDSFSRGRLVEEIAKLKKISGLSALLQLPLDQIFEWLNKFIEYLIDSKSDSLLNDAQNPILPDQNGDFKTKDELSLDNDDIDETLKNIAAGLGYDFRKTLLEKAVYLKLPENREIGKQKVADKISELVRPRFSETPRSEETRKYFSMLFLWFKEDPEEAENIFSELYASRFRLYGDEEMAINMKKAEVLDGFLDQGLTEAEIIRLSKRKDLKKLAEMSDEDTVDEIPPTGEEILRTLTRLGITNAEELQKALADKQVVKQFEYLGSGMVSVEMFQHVMGLIERAKANIQKYLSSQQEYDVQDWQEESITVISGVKKFDRLITVVVRPSDGGQVIFYYGTEKDALERRNAEFWIDNGLADPQHLTLGRIIKRNQISRIDV